MRAEMFSRDHPKGATGAQSPQAPQAKDGDAPQEEGLPLPDFRGINRGRRVLLIEDAEIDAELIIDLLKSDNRIEEIRHAEDGEQALRLLKEGLEPDFIITDLNMPSVSGFDVIEAVRAGEQEQVDLFSRWERKPQHIPIVVLTSSDRVSDFYKSNRAQANCFITKPNELSELKLLLRRVVKLVVWGKTMPPHLDASSAETVAQKIKEETDAAHQRMTIEEMLG